MEDGLGHANGKRRSRPVLVLILVLMEDGLGHYFTSCLPTPVVLILVLMEDGLGLYSEEWLEETTSS